MRHTRLVFGSVAALCLTVGAAGAAGAQNATAGCAGLPTAAQIRTLLWNASRAGNPYGEAGGLFHGRRMWGAVVNRDGVLCAFATTANADPRQVWPGSQAIAKAKAYTANAFSTNDLAISTAMLYTFTQPGHSLWGLNQSNPFDPDCLAPISGSGGGSGAVCGGIISFGGGVPLYGGGGRIVGGLGISGDTACSDHEVAKRARDLAGLNPPGGKLVDDITYTRSAFAHPVCLNTYKNGRFVGNEAPSVYPRAQ